MSIESKYIKNLIKNESCKNESSMHRCSDCAFYTEKQADTIFGRKHSYWVCSNAEAFNTGAPGSPIWWPDGTAAGMENYSGEVFVGMNFGCVNWQEKPEESVNDTEEDLEE